MALVTPITLSLVDGFVSWSRQTDEVQITPEMTTAEQVAAIEGAIDSGLPFVFKRGAVYDDLPELNFTNPVPYVAWYGDKQLDRPKLRFLKPASWGFNLQWLSNTDTTSFMVIGLDMDGSNTGQELPYSNWIKTDFYAIRGKVTGGSTKTHSGIVIEDCIFRRWDTGVHLVDDNPRTEAAGTEGAIEVAIRRNMFLDMNGNDGHSLGIYGEGWADGSLIEQNFFDYIGFTAALGRNAPDFGDPSVPIADKRSHGIYLQQFGGEVVVRENIFRKCAAHAIQHRVTGINNYNVMFYCAISSNIGSVQNAPGKESQFLGNLFGHQEDISEDEARGKGFAPFYSDGGLDADQNIFFDRRGTATGGQGVGMEIPFGTTATDNVFVDWAHSNGTTKPSGGTNTNVSGLSIDYNGTYYDIAPTPEGTANVDQPPHAFDDNYQLDAPANYDSYPDITEEDAAVLRARRLGEWRQVDHVSYYIDQARATVKAGVQSAYSLTPANLDPITWSVVFTDINPDLVTSMAELTAARDAQQPNIIVASGTYDVADRSFAIQHKCNFTMQAGAELTTGTLWFTAGADGSNITFETGSALKPSHANHKGGLLIQSDNTTVTGGTATDLSRATNPSTPTYSSDYPPDDEKPVRDFGLYVQGAQNVTVTGFTASNFWFGIGTGLTCRNVTFDGCEAYDSYEHAWYLQHNFDLRVLNCKGIRAGQLALKVQSAASTPSDIERVTIQNFVGESRYTGLFVNQVTRDTDKRFKDIILSTIDLTLQTGGLSTHQSVIVEATDGLTIEGLTQTGYASDLTLVDVTSYTGPTPDDEEDAESLTDPINAIDTAVDAVTPGLRNRWKLDETRASVTTASDTGTDVPRNGVIGSAVSRGRGNLLTSHVNRRACMEFAGTANSTIDITGWTIPSGDFSFSFWVKSDAAFTTTKYIFSHGDGTLNNYFHFLTNGGNLQLRAYRGGANIGLTTSGVSFDTDTWYFVTYTLTGSTPALYINGSLASTVTGTTLGAVTGAHIGGYADDTSANRLDGLMQDVMVFDGPLTSDEATSLWDARIPATAVFYDDFENASNFSVTGATATASGNTLSITNTLAGAATAPAGSVPTDEAWAMQGVVNPDGGAGVRCRIQLLDGASTVVGTIDFVGTSIELSVSGTGVDTVIPTSWDHDDSQRILIAGDPSTLELHFWLLHNDTAGNDQYEYLGEVAMPSAPDRFRFAWGGTIGTSVFSGPWGVWRASDVIATIGTSIPKGSPLYDPCPRHFANSDENEPNQLGFWLYDNDADEYMIVNFGKGGSGATYADARSGWIGDLKPRRVFIDTGTNDVNDVSPPDPLTVVAKVQSFAEAVHGTYGIPVTVGTMAARPNAIDADQHLADRTTFNNAVRENANSWGATYLDIEAATTDPGNSKLLVSDFDADSVHFTAAAQQAVGVRWRTGGNPQYLSTRFESLRAGLYSPLRQFGA